ncbi:E3 ubiquitin-protein ligase TRIM35-like [Scyliorhinus torazame]|uniref:E3 ubiquitin-protein ligase TRIM35-like n=1 Tax=Scyliorhinus torazame TaxID=75743 RepID=UPI003B595389
MNQVWLFNNPFLLITIACPVLRCTYCHWSQRQRLTSGPIDTGPPIFNSVGPEQPSEMSNFWEMLRNDQRKELCSLHKEKVKLFCKTDNQLICVVCQSSKSHQTHGLLPLEEAAEEFKAKLRTFLKPVQDKKKDCNAVRSDYEKILNHIQDQGTNAEKQINAQFEKLHQFLREEERIVLEGLKLEKEEKSQEMKERIEKITEEISSLSAAVQDIEQELREQDNIKFLMVALHLFFFFFVASLTPCPRSCRLAKKKPETLPVTRTEG